jgi:putative flippase GtrA
MAALDPRKLTSVVDRWFTRSLAVGAVAAALDWSTAGALLWAGAPTVAATMSGATLGAALGYLGNRHFAFRGDASGHRGSLLRFVLVTSLVILVHGQVVGWLTRSGLPFAPAKVIADMTLFNGVQLLLLRYVVFPPRPPNPVN